MAEPGAVRTYGLTHVAIAVADVERALRFYEQVFGMVAVYRDPGFVQMQTPGMRDVLVFEKTESGGKPGATGGVKHFGFRLVDPAAIDAVAEAILAAGGSIMDKGEFIPGEPYVFFRDPDGYEVEVWYEIPTKADPKT